MWHRESEQMLLEKMVPIDLLNTVLLQTDLWKLRYLLSAKKTPTNTQSAIKWGMLVNTQFQRDAKIPPSI